MFPIISRRCTTGCGACAPNSTCARIPPGAGSSPRSAPRFRAPCSRKWTPCPGGSGASYASAPTKDILAGARIDASEVDDAAALIDFIAVCRTYASELAINEVTLRTYSDLQQYVEKSTEALVQSLRAGDVRARGYREMQANAAVRFCEVLFGREYASLMSRALDNALTSERKSSRAS